MDAWTTATTSSLSGLSKVGGSGFSSQVPDILNLSDPLLSKIITSKKALQLIESNLVSGDESNTANKMIIQLLMASCDGDAVTLENIARSHPELVDQLFPSDSNGATALIYAVCFNNSDIVQSLLNNHNADPDLPDSIIKYTPIMWAVHLNQLEMVKLLISHQADPYLSPNDDGKNAISLVYPEHTEMYDYFKSHNLLKPKLDGDDEEVFGADAFTPTQDEFEDDFARKLKMQTLTSSPSGSKYEEDEQEEQVHEEDDEYTLSQNIELKQTPEFEYDKLLPEQYIKFTDSDIPSLLNYIFNLRSQTTYQHNTKLPATIVFQLIRYSALKVESSELSDFLFDCFTARLRTVTNTKSGAFNMAIQDDGNPANAHGAGDIVLLSYWLSSLQFLHFYFGKNEIYSKYPRFLQEIISLVQSLIATLSFSINSRLNLLVDDCIINFTNLVDVSNVLYAKDWNLFKKNKSHPNTYDDILNTLYPPSQNELMKPSPIKYLQVLGALDYVLKIHNVDNLLRSETYSQVFYYINCTIFNRIISQSKYCTRSKAIQIRLNISAIEDWLRSHNMKVYKPETIGGLSKLIKAEDVKLHYVLNEDSDPQYHKNPHYLQFYYHSLYHVGKYQLQPVIELLQWLQCMSSLNDEESLINTINQFDCLNYYQLVKVANKLYKYEVNEDKLPKKLINVIKALMNEQGPNQIKRLYLHYMTQTTFLSKEEYIYLNPNFIFEVALPNLTELINNYGAGLGGVRILRNKKYQPTLPIAIIDEIDEIQAENNSWRDDSYNYAKEGEGDEEGEADYDDDREENGEANEHGREEKESLSTDGILGFKVDSPTTEKDGFKGDEIFKQVQMPNSLLHKNWGDTGGVEDFEANPW
ncbi:Dilute domain-containing protein [Candida tropicalis]